MLGSTPSRTINMLAISRTIPFRQLQAGIGRSTYRLNTIVVGLELVAEGGQKPAALNVKWNAPATAPVARQVADQAKSFALVSALVYGADLFDSYLRSTADAAWLRFSPNTAFVTGRHGTGPGGHEYSMMERALRLTDELGITDDYLPAMLDLLAKWRNNLVHGGRGKGRGLDSIARRHITDCAQQLHDAYANIDVGRTLRAFDAGAFPSRKDATVLLAACQNLARAIDEAIRRAVPDAIAMETLADSFLSDRWKKKADTRRGWQEFCSLWDQAGSERERGLVKVLGQMAIASSKEPVSPALGQRYISDLAGLDRANAELRLALI